MASSPCTVASRPSSAPGPCACYRGVTEYVVDTLLATKLYLPPPRRDLIQRPRLIERLSAALCGPLTLLVAPAGSGKTTLLSGWRAAQQEDAHGLRWPLAWLALDAA